MADDEIPDPGASADRRRWKWPKPRLAWFWVLPIGLLVLLGWYFVERAADTDNPFTSLEQLFFGVYTLFVGSGASWLISSFYASRETENQFRQLARPALRRVAAARESAEGLLAAIDRRGEDSEMSEPFRSLRELVEQHARVLDDAIADWREVLPEEAGLALDLVALGKQQERRFDQIQSQFRGLEQAVESASGSREDSNDPRIDLLRTEIESLRKQVQGRPRPSSWGTTSVSVGGTGVSIDPDRRIRQSGTPKNPHRRSAGGS